MGLVLWKSVIKKSLREIEITWSTVKTFSEEIETGQRRRDRKFSKKLKIRRSGDFESKELKSRF